MEFDKIRKWTNGWCLKSPTTRDHHHYHLSIHPLAHAPLLLLHYYYRRGKSIKLRLAGHRSAYVPPTSPLPPSPKYSCSSGGTQSTICETRVHMWCLHILYELSGIAKMGLAININNIMLVAGLRYGRVRTSSAPSRLVDRLQYGSLYRENCHNFNPYASRVCVCLVGVHCAMLRIYKS